MAVGVIPKRLIRTVAQQTTVEVEGYWEGAKALHPGWDYVTFRDPIDPRLFPLTADTWDRCTSGAQLAGLIRLEALWHQGGVYLDSDVEVFKSFEPLTFSHAFAAWEDANTIPDAVMGSEAHHPAIGMCIALALRRLGPRNAENGDWKTGPGAWSTGPGVTTTILAGRDDVTVYGPELFYPIHYSEKEKLEGFVPGPETYAIHRWHASWLA